MKATKRTTVDVLRGLVCLLEPDPTGEMCWNCPYDCSDPKLVRERILNDAKLMLGSRIQDSGSRSQK